MLLLLLTMNGFAVAANLYASYLMLWFGLGHRSFFHLMIAALLFVTTNVALLYR